MNQLFKIITISAVLLNVLFGWGLYAVHSREQELLAFSHIIEQIQAVNNGVVPSHVVLASSEIYKQKYPELVNADLCPCYTKTSDSEYEIYVGGFSVGESFIYNSKSQEFRREG